MRNRKGRILKLLAASYCLLMIWLLFGQRMEYPPGSNELKINLVPFETISQYIKELSHRSTHAFINLAGNVIMFVPLGFFVPALRKKSASFPKALCTAAAIILTVEALQLMTRLGSMDIDDLLLNLLGVTFGYGIYRLSVKIGIL